VAAVTPPPPPAAPAARPSAPAPTPPPGRTLDQIFNDTMRPILFDYDKATIRADQVRNLLNSAAWLKQNPNVRLNIEGHADERGGQEYNIALGDERAAAVKKFLADQGITDARMNTVSYGEERPSCRVESESCWQENRRAAFSRIP
jgi:peptidoglycan-associated lipoprotein